LQARFQALALFMHEIQVEGIKSIEAPGRGHVGWPTVAKKQNGELVVVYSGGRRQHVCPFGQVHLITSHDEGESWTQPRVLVDGPLDDRDAGALETKAKTLIVNWFTSRLWEMRMQNPSDPWHSYSAGEKADWVRRNERLTDEIRQRELGAWCIRSEDGGQSWSSKIPTVVNSPHGPCELSDGRLLYVGKKVTDDSSQAHGGTSLGGAVGVAHSKDDGQSWQMLAKIAPRPGHESAEYHELHAVQADDETIIAHIRNHNELYRYEILQIESRDGGASWSSPHPIGVWGYPSFLLRTGDGRLITTFGHRREPFGNYVSISEDNGKNWSKALPINTDSAGDMGYPSTVELTPSRFLSVWYDTAERDRTYLRSARWHLA
jgi:hypothetical protein